MQRYAFCVAYSGARFSGWQEQAVGCGITVAGELKKSFLQTFRHPVKIVGASRTDAGVHALGQVAAITTSLDIAPEKLLFAWRNALPGDIYIRRLVRVPLLFHPQRDVVFKEYQYRFARRAVLPHWAPYCASYPYAIDSARFLWSVQQFMGTYDFWSFGSSSSDSAGVATTCTIDHASCRYDSHADMWIVVIRGKRFIHHMVRRMVGAALRYASYQELEQSYIISALNGRVDRMTIPTAPAQGLVLRKIIYKEGGSYEYVAR